MAQVSATELGSGPERKGGATVAGASLFAQPKPRDQRAIAANVFSGEVGQ